MKKFKLNLILLMAVIFGIASAYGVYLYLESVKAAYVEKGDFVKVAVAKQHIPPKTLVSPQAFTMEEVPAKYVNDNAAVDPAEVTGKLTKTAIYPDEQILKGKLVGKEDPPEELAFIIPEGQRAVTVAVNEVSGVAGLIRPGDSIDLLVTFEDEDQGAMTSLILQNIKVLATDQNMSTVSARGSEEKIYQTVTLSATPQQAQPLVLASEQGSVRLMLRPTADQGTPGVHSTKMKDLVR